MPTRISLSSKTLSSKEIPALGIQRLLLRALAKSQNDLRARQSEEKRIHETRKSLKRARALLRLLRPSLGERLFQRENEVYRKVAQYFGDIRDWQVMQQTLAKLSATIKKKSEPRQLAELKAYINKRASDKARVPGASEALFLNAQAELKLASDRVMQWHLVELDLVRVLGRSYKGAGKRKLVAFQTGTDFDFHEWRKKVKTLLYQMEILRDFRNASVKKRISVLESLGEKLGEDHDLAVFRVKLMDLRLAALKHEFRREFIIAAEQRQKQLRVEAHKLAAQVFGTEPKAFKAEVSGCWPIKKEPS